MKRIIAFVLSLIMLLTLCACGETEKEKLEEEKLDVGKTASTDLAEFTLENAQFAYYLDNTFMSENYLVPTDDANEVFGASLGHCLVSLTFTLTSKNRANHIDFAGIFTDWDPNFTVTYSGESYPVNGFDLNDSDGCDYFSLAYSVIGSEYRMSDAMNYLLAAGETVTIRAFGVVAVDPENLSDGFDLSVDVLNLKGEHETFVYTIPAKA